MSSPKSKPTLKKVHYERGTKPGHVSPRSPRSSHHSSSSPSEELDSGFGSSSSNTASLGGDDDHSGPSSSKKNAARLSPGDIHTQRAILSACQEALDAANAPIRLLEAAHARLDAQLADSNKANRLLKREKRELEDETEALREELRERDLSDGEKKARRERRKREQEKEREKDKKEKERERRTTPPRREVEVDYIRPALERRMSSYRDHLPVVTQSPMNTSPNPFTPISERPTVTYQPAQGTYVPNTMSYASGPVFAHAPPQGPRATIPNDGRYHLTPI